MVNELKIDLSNAHFWGMDEWYVNGREMDAAHPLSFEKADRDLCFSRIEKKYRMPDSNLHFPKADIGPYITSWESGVRCAVMQGGQGDTKHWAFNDPVKREGKYKDSPPTPEEFRKLTARVVDLHPVTCMQNARTSSGGVVTGIPMQALTVGPVQTWIAETVSIWHAGTHDNAFGQRLTALMISKNIIDSSVPMSLLAGHPDVKFNYYKGGFGTCETEMH
jgi:glucosamine-6-phosphate deaminase